MKKLSIILSLLLLFSSVLFAQSVGINDDCSTPDPKAILDLKSSSKGFLPPRMTTAEINAIAPIPEGLNVYNTTLHTMVFYDGTTWKKTDGTPMTYSVGQSYFGGIIFYVDGSGQHGLIAATIDQSTGAQWGCYGSNIAGTSFSIGTGQANTNLIVNECADAGIAARICDDLVLNGYSDWFLPSTHELLEMYYNQVAIGGFSPVVYWSSSQAFPAVNFNAVGVDFLTGAFNATEKNGPHYVRAIRAF